MSDRSALVQIVERLEGARVLCIGDAMLDRFVSGSVDRISPEAPIPVLRISDEKAMMGGAGNVIRNVVALGGKADFISVLGQDGPGFEFAELMGMLKGVDDRTLKIMGRHTTVKTRFLSGAQQMLRADHEVSAPIDAALEQKVVDAIFSAVPECHCVALSDYGKGVLTDRVLSAAIEAGVGAGIPVIVDPKGRDYAKYKGASLVTPNRKELVEATSLPAGSDDEIIAAATQLIKANGIHAVLVTRSQDGMTLVTNRGDVHHLKAEARDVFDVSGAGDTVVAAIASALASGAELVDACTVANAAAGIVVGKVGTAVAYASEVVATLHHQDLANYDAKVRTLDEATDLVEAWRRQDKAVGFTNGCFDLLHPGHVSLLDQARAACDRLVVGLNSDASVKRLKGESRPVQTDSARAQVLASLAAVDLVVIFDEDTPLNAIQALKPDVLIKGADYTVETVVGAKEVQSWGGRVVLANLKKGHSTTATLKRLGSGS